MKIYYILEQSRILQNNVLPFLFEILFKNSSLWEINGFIVHNDPSGA
tara:strand:- start:65 stop:205 length:141 start_codon:yes stop_codon:yes gene_type:complete